MHPGLKYLIKTYRPLKGWPAVWVYAALGLGIAAMVMLFRFAERVEATVNKDARKFLAADYQIQSRRKPTEDVMRVARAVSSGDAALALQTDMVASSLLPNGESLTVSLRALENNAYPFYGTFRLSPQLGIEALRGGGSYGVFVDASMRERGLKLGDEVSLGSIRAKVLAYIEEEPQSVASAFALGPRFIIHQEALAASHLADYGAYAFYSLLMKSSRPYLEVQKAMREGISESTWRLVSPERANRQTERIVTRLESFLMLIAFAAFVLGGVGLFAIARFQILRNLSDWILFKALGLTKSDLIKFSVFWITLVSLVALAIGFGLGAVMETQLSNYARVALGVDLAPIGTWAALPHALLLALGASVLALGLPLWQVVSISPNRAWSAARSKSMDASSKTELWIYGGATLLIGALAAFDIIARSWLVAIFWGAATWLGAVIVRRLSLRVGGREGSVLKRYPFLWVHRSWSELKVLNYSIAAAIYLMVLVAVIGSTLREQLSVGRAESAPQAVALGVLQDQKDGVRLPDRAKVKWVPTLQIRITAIKGVAVKMTEFDETGERVESDDNSNFSLTREYVVSPRTQLEGNESVSDSFDNSGNLFSNQVVDGGGLRMSLEREFADRLEVKPGDALTVSVAGVELPARVDSVRAVQWFRFQPSFFILLHPEDLAGAPLNYVGLFNGVSDLRALQRGLQAQYPNVTVIDSKSVAERLVTLIDRVILAISSLGIFVLIAAAWVYVAIIVSRRAAFRQDLYLIRLMGGSGAALRKLARRHFVFLSLSTGIIASALAIASSWVLAGSVFGIALSWSAATWSMGGAVLISGVFALVGYALSGPYSRWLNASQQELNF